MPVANLIQGAGTLYTAAFGTAEPADTAIGSAPGGSWVDVGLTDGGLTMRYTAELSDLEVDQMVDMPETRLTSREFHFITALAEATLDNLAVAIRQMVTSSGAGFAARVPGAAATVARPDYVALLFDGHAPGVGKRRRVIIRKGLQVASLDVPYQKDNKTMVPIDIKGYGVDATNTIAPFKIIDAT